MGENNGLKVINKDIENPIFTTIIIIYSPKRYIFFLKKLLINLNL